MDGDAAALNTADAAPPSPAPPASASGEETHRPSGSLEHLEGLLGGSRASWRWYADGQVQPGVALDHAVDSARAGAGYVWVGLNSPTEELMDELAVQFELHELASEDVIEGHQRSKLESFDDYLFLVVSTVDYVEHDKHADNSEIVSTGEIMVFLGSWFVITIRRGGRSHMKALRRRFEADPDEMVMGSWRVLYRVLDLVIDDFAQTAQEMEEDVELVEAAVFAPDGTHQVERPYQLKREIIEFKRCVFPLQAPLAQLQTRPSPAIPPDARAYFRELGDHLLETREDLLSLDEVLGTILQAALARASVADNQDMRKISAAVAILAVPTTIGAIYGMNFENMPELSSPIGYFVVLGVMAILMLLVYLFMRHRRWL